MAAKLRRLASWSGRSAAAAAIGAVVGGALEAATADDGALVAVTTAGYAAVAFVPALWILSMVARAVWRAWRPAELAAGGLVDASGAAPRLAGWIAYLGLAGIVLSWAMFNAIRVIAVSTAFHPTTVALLTPPIAVFVTLVLVALSRPSARGLGALLGRLDARLRRRFGRSVITPRTVLAAAVAIAIGLAFLGWTISVSPRIGYLELTILHGPLAALAAAALAHPLLARLGGRARLATAATAGGLLAIAFGVAMWAGAARPLVVLQAWARPTIAAEVIERWYVLEDLRLEIDLSVAKPVMRPGETPHDIVLVTIDTVRADRTPLASPSTTAAAMPNLARLGNEGAVFAWAFAPGNVTRRAVTSLATGLSPPRVRGKVAGWALRLDPRHVLLAERFRAAGYDTAGFFCCPSFWADKHHLGLNRGIDHVTIQNDGGLLASLTVDWLRARDARPGPKRPLFLWVHFIEPHNWAKGAAARTEADRRAAYDASLTTVDKHLGVVLDAFAARPGAARPYIIVTADHGEGLGQHGAPYHSTDLYNSQIHVPLVVAGPGVPAHRVVEPVGLVDLAPTLLDLAGYVPPGMPDMDGRSLATLAKTIGPGDPNGGYAFAAMIADRSVPRGARAIVKGRWKLIETYRGLELYDIVIDPNELRDQSKLQPARLAEMRRLLDARKQIDTVSAFGTFE